MTKLTWNSLNRKIENCQLCERLVLHCQTIGRARRKAYANEEYWAQPVPNFGDSNAQLLIVGLAPGAHGANRTGRMFTGDRSGDWLYRALHKAGFANQPKSTDRTDGLQLANVAITAVCNCAPPDNKPTRAEIQNCQPWFEDTVDLLNVPVFLALGKIAWDATIDLAKRRGWYSGARPKFGHAAEIQLENETTLVGCYHPSQQNTFTGRLTEEMLDEIFSRIKLLLENPTSAY